MPAFLYRIPFRIYSIVIVALALSALISFLLLSRAVENAYDMRKTELHGMTDAAISLLSGLQARVAAGEIDKATAEARGRELLETLRFGASGYVFALTNDLVITAHPMLPDWVGTDKSDYADVNGLKLFQEMRKVALRDGSGPVEYWFKKPGETEPEMKLGYVQEFKPWGWFVGTGAYVSDIHGEMASMRHASAITQIVGMLILVAISFVLVRSVTRPLASFVLSMNDVADARYETAIPEARRRDEIGDLGRNLAAFRDKLAESERLAAAREEDRREQERVVADLASGLRSLSEGDLTSTIDTKFADDYEQLRQDFNATVETLNALMGEIVENATEITTRAEEISGASDDLSRRTENQAATLEQTAAAMDEMTASVRAAAEGAAKVEDVVREARGNAEQSGLVVKEAIGAMSEIKKSSDGINQIIGVIDDIAFQTNLLALNAGVEAARAGEAGRGFAVVASEVRALAQRSSEAAKEIKTLISASSDQVETGVSLVNRGGAALTDIVERVGNIATLIADIATGAQEQSVGLGEINVGVNELDKVTQQNAAMVEEANAAAVTMKQEAGNLQTLVARFRLKGPAATVSVRPRTETAIPAAAPAPAAEFEPPKRAVNDAGWQDF
ncbi:methyl-accepting chemotaxis protein [Rhodovulum sulfidophilum]|uniref:methyl-accepting chemotaxis protein n=1 Tax=Rhodovulum sulfidophilum TaxID=35806 RepID=UPI0009528AB2|nr:methyl-accepting chemotaxis protein [Rhodovulum sulfidophilum]MBL3553059.1 cache domain-containing protein [Rhodovulum sulfidophilum]OLS48423.1 chemotaxis protein [Rhodovulum sulfidophilum]